MGPEYSLDPCPKETYIREFYVDIVTSSFYCRPVIVCFKSSNPLSNVTRRRVAHCSYAPCACLLSRRLFSRAAADTRVPVYPGNFLLPDGYPGSEYL